MLWLLRFLVFCSLLTVASAHARSTASQQSLPAIGRRIRIS